MSRYSTNPADVRELSDAAFGRALYPTLPEDDFDRQPLVGRAGAAMMVADIRIDNRDELCTALRRNPSASMSDSALLLQCYERWGEDVLTRVVGDFAVAIWQPQSQTLLLARDMAGQRPLHYRIGKHAVAFASMPVGLATVADGGLQIDQRQLASFVADIPRSGSSSFFSGVSRVEPGHVVKMTRTGVTAFSFVQTPSRELNYPDDRDYIIGWTEQLERAIKSRLRSRSSVGAHLSAGLDSGAVAATAARLMGRERLLAFTSAPRENFDGPSFPGRIADESALAAQTAALYPNMDHVVVRSRGSSIFSGMGDVASYQEPIGHPCNHVWWTAINEEARNRGVSVMLTGEAGNHTITAGGLVVLSDLVRAGQWGRWANEAWHLGRSGNVSLPGLLATSFGSWMPSPVWTYLRGIRNNGSSTCSGFSLLQPEWQEALQYEAKAAARGERKPPRNLMGQRWAHLQEREPGSFRKGALAQWGVDERDPTADRRLAEFCIAIPTSKLLRDGETRHVARAALKGALPDSVLTGVRGYQFADWYEGLERRRLDLLLQTLRRSDVAAAILDLPKVAKLIESWPPRDISRSEAIGTYRVTMLRALAAGQFASELSR